MSQTVPNDGLGQLLLNWELVTEEQLENGLADQSTSCLPLGLRLVAAGHLSHSFLRDAVLMQSFMRDSIVSKGISNQAFGLIRKKQISISLALDLLGVQTGQSRQNRLGEILFESQCFDRNALKARLNLCKVSGLPLGRVVLATSTLKSNLVDQVLHCQKALRSGNVCRDTLIESIKSTRSFNERVTSIGRELTDQHSRLGTLFLVSGFISDAQLSNALQICSQYGLRLGDVLVRKALVSTEIVDATLELQRLVRVERISMNQCLKILRQIRLTVLDTVDTALPPATNNTLDFQKFVNLAGLRQSKQHDSGLQQVSESGEAKGMGCSNTWEKLSSLIRYNQPADAESFGEANEYFKTAGLLPLRTRELVFRAAQTYRLYKAGAASLDESLLSYFAQRDAKGNTSAQMINLPIPMVCS